MSWYAPGTSSANSAQGSIVTTPTATEIERGAGAIGSTTTTRLEQSGHTNYRQTTASLWGPRGFPGGPVWTPVRIRVRVLSSPFTLHVNALALVRETRARAHFLVHMHDLLVHVSRRRGEAYGSR